jgi:hypothetical protein
VVDDELLSVGVGHGSGEQVALAEGAPFVDEGVPLDLVFDALRDDVELEGAGEVEQAADDGGEVPRVVDAINERPVDLEDVERELLEVAER